MRLIIYLTCRIILLIQSHITWPAPMTVLDDRYLDCGFGDYISGNDTMYCDPFKVSCTWKYWLSELFLYFMELTHIWVLRPVFYCFIVFYNFLFVYYKYFYQKKNLLRICRVWDAAATDTSYVVQGQLARVNWQREQPIETHVSFQKLRNCIVKRFLFKKLSALL